MLLLPGGSSTPLFLEHYLSPVHRSIKKDDFRSFIQGNMYVTEYEAKLESLSRFEKGLDNDFKEKIRLFLKGLKLSIKKKVYHLNYSSVTEAVRMAMKVEQKRANTSRFLEKKRGIEENKSGNQGKKYRSDYGSSSGSGGHFLGSGSENQEP
ncbi:hypothetical protein LguiA_017482 [Lonicera macranthoides]